MINIILTSALISTFASSIVTILLRRIDFRQQYDKLIIEKRIEAYQYIEQMLHEINLLHLFEGKQYSVIFESLERLHNYMKNAEKISHDRLWISNITFNKLLELNTILSTIEHDVFEKKRGEIELRDNGIKFHKDIQTLSRSISNLITEDYISLFSISKFFNDKKKYLKQTLK